MKIDLYIDLANLEYDDSPYAGRTNLGNVLIPYFAVNTGFFEVNAGGWYRHIYVSYDENESPDRVYPYINAIFHPWQDSDFLIGNYANLALLPNTIYNEFFFFEERPVCAGLKFTLDKESLFLSAYMDWIEQDTEEHPEEFITGLIFRHSPADWFYYKFFNHYHHRGGQLHKDSHPVRIEQDIVFSPAAGFSLMGVYAEFAYYLSTFSQNFEPSIYGNAGSATLGFAADNFDISYQCFYNRDYYHQDAHIFYLKRKNCLHRFRFDWNLMSYRDVIDFMFTVNLYGMDPPGIDFRLFAKINLDIVLYSKPGKKE